MIEGTRPRSEGEVADRLGTTSYRNGRASVLVWATPIELVDEQIERPVERLRTSAGIWIAIKTLGS